MTMRKHLGRPMERISVLKRMDPLTKLICLAIVAVAMLVYSSPVANLLMGSVVCVVAFLTWIRTERSFRSIVPLLTVSLLLGLFHLVADAGEPWASYGFISISKEGIRNALLFSSRLLTVALATLTFIWTTELSELALALQSLGCPYRFAFALTLAVRFVPLVENQVRHITTALTLRGCTRTWRVRTVILRAKLLLVSVSVRSLHLGQTTAAALDSRGFGVYSERTMFRSLRLTLWGCAVTVALLLYAVILLYLDRAGILPSGVP